MWTLILSFALAADFDLAEQINQSEQSEAEISAQVGASAPRRKIDTSDLTTRQPGEQKKRLRLEGAEESVVAPLTEEYFRAPASSPKKNGTAAEEKIDLEIRKRN